MLESYIPVCDKSLVGDFWATTRLTYNVLV